jgi:hypothetical protein
LHNITNVVYVLFFQACQIFNQVDKFLIFSYCIKIMSELVTRPTAKEESADALSQSLSVQEPDEMPTVDDGNVNSSVLSALERTGQVGNNSLSRQVLGGGFISELADQVSNIEAPQREAQEFSDVPFLSEGEERLFTERSQLITDQGNLARDSLARQLSGQVSAIEQSVQDRATISSIQTGEAGAGVERSTRNLSFVTNAQAVGQQQIIDTANNFVEQLSQIDLQGRQAETDLLGQAVQTQQQNRSEMRNLADRMTQSLGTLHEVDEQGTIIDTGVQTLQGRASEIDLMSGQFQLDAARAEASEIYQLDNDGMIKFGADGQAMVTDLGELRRQADNLLTMAETEEARMAINNMVQQQELMNMFSSPENLTEAQERWGSAVGRYYGVQVGEEGMEGLYDNSALSQIGLDLNTTFQGAEGSPISSENMQEIKQMMALDISNAMFSGESSSFMNKVYAESDDRNKMLFALRNVAGTSEGYEEGYNFFEMDTSGLSAKDANDLRQRLNDLDTSDPKVFENFLNITSDFEGKGLANRTDLGATGFMDRLSTGGYTKAKNNEIIPGVKTSQLVGAVLMGTTAGSLKNLENMNLIRLNDDGFVDFEPMRSSWVTNADDAILALSRGSFSNNPQGLDKALKAYQGNLKVSDVPENSRVFFKQSSGDNLEFDPNTKKLLEGLVNVQKFMEKSISDPERLNDTYTAFLTSTMGTYGVDNNKAKDILNVVNTIRSGKAGGNTGSFNDITRQRLRNLLGN